MIKNKSFCMILLGVLCSLTVYGSTVPRKVEISGEAEKCGRISIVVEKDTPLLKFAAKELQFFLKQAANQNVPVLRAPAKNGISLILGDNSFARKAGIDVAKLPPEGYYIIRNGNHLFLAGKDSPVRTPDGNNWEQVYKRGSLSAVYDFLERFASVRYYFPGPYGTIVPARGALYLPSRIHIMERPDMPTRNYTTHRTKYYPTYPDYTRKDNKASGDTLTRVRLRFSEFIINGGGHGLNRLEYVRRFSKSNPEYFAMMPDGRRYNEPGMIHSGQLCFSSGLREVIYQDAKAALLNKDPRTRGLKAWHYNLRKGSYVSLGPQDWLYWCGCEKCSKIAEVGRGKIYRDKAHRQRVSNFMWAFYAGIANRLAKEGVKGMVCASVYPPYDMFPDCEIPANVHLQVCINGKGGEKRETEILRKWYEVNRKNKLNVWTYVLGKHMSKKIPGVIPMNPRGIGRFIDDNKKYIKGGYFESESDYFLFQYLNYYILAKKFWDNSVSVEELLDEHYRVMFGKGAPFMKKFYDSLEQKWCNQILGSTVDTGLGPVVAVPRDYEIWNRIFSPAVLKQYDSLFDQALRAAAADKGAVKRLKFMREHFYGPLRRVAEERNSMSKALDNWVLTCPGTVFLRPTREDVADVSTRVSVRKDAKNFYFTFECEEPRMKAIRAVQKGRDQARTYEDSDVELFLNPSGDRKNYFQFVVNTNGALADYRCQVGKKPDLSWNSSATAKVVKKAASWSAVITVPIKDLGKNIKETFPVNFCRARNLITKKKRSKSSGSFFWSPISGRGGFHAIENWGYLRWKGKEKSSIIFKADFTQKKLPYCWRSAGDKGGQLYYADKKIFMTGGQSLYFKNLPKKSMGMSFRLNNLEPNTRYRASGFIRTRNIQSRGRSGGAYISVNIAGIKKTFVLPQGGVSGTAAWHRVSGEFKTPAVIGRRNLISCALRTTGGEAWFDELIVEKIK